MTQRAARSLGAGLLLAACTLAAARGPYDETADARAEIAAARVAAQSTRQPLLLVFGANWCPDCKVLDLAFKDGASAALIASRYKVVKVDVGRFDRNLDVARAYGVPLKSGIPAVAVLDSLGKPVYVTRAGELADARRMGDQGILAFFQKLTTDLR
jgi:protein disulfide-isomerase